MGKNNMVGDRGGNQLPLIFLSVFVVISLSIWTKVFFDKHLSLDGVNYFFHILENQGFANIAWSRRFTEYLTEWPLVFAVRAGIVDIEVLVKIFAIGIYFPYLLSFLLCWYVVRDENKALLWFPIAGYFGFNVLSDYDLIADHHVLAVMTWPILLILLKTRPLLWLEGIVLWMLLFAYSRMYETAVLMAGVLGLIAIVRLIAFKRRQERIILSVAILLLGITAFIAVSYIMDPRSPGNRGNFLDSIWVNKRNWEAVTICSFFTIFSLGWLINSRFGKIKNLVFLASLLPVALYVFLRLTTDYAMTAYISFSSRTLIGLVIPGLIVFGVIVVVSKRVLNSVGMGSFILTLIVMTAFNTYDLRHWIGVKKEITRVIKSDQMFVSIDETLLANSHYRWSWNNSLLSLVWAGDCVNTIILNSPDDPQGPFNPKERLILKRYLMYHKDFAAVDPNIVTCQ